MTTDIDEIERLLAAATPGEWDTEFDPIDAGDHATAVCLPAKAGSLGTFLAYCRHNWGEAVYNERRISWKEATSNAALIVTLHNSAPAMLAEIRELRAENARLRPLVEECRRVHSFLSGVCSGSITPPAGANTQQHHARMLREYRNGARLVMNTIPAAARAALGEPQ